MARTKVLFLHHGGGIGGAPVSMLQLARGLDPKRYEPVVYFTQPGPILGFAKEMGVNAGVSRLRSAFFYSAHVPIRARMLVPFLHQFKSTIRAAQSLVRMERPDVVHLNTSVLVPAAIGIKREGVPLVWHVREVPGPNRLLRNWHLAKIRHLADHVITTSDYVRRELGTCEHISTIHNSADARQFNINLSEARTHIREELHLPGNSPVIGMIGSIQKIKGHDLIIDAARRVVTQQPEARFLVVAGGVCDTYRKSKRGRIKLALRVPLDNLDRMLRRVRAAGLEDNFVFSGYRIDIPDILAAMDVLVFPSQAPEGFGRPLIEAMATGRPIVATDLGPTREIVGDGGAVFVKPGDSKGLADSLLNLLEDQELFSRLRDEGKRRFLNNFELDAMVAKIQQVYENVLRDGSRVPSSEVSQSIGG